VEPAATCEAQGNYNVAFELQQEALSGRYLVDKGRLDRAEEIAIKAFASTVSNLPKSALVFAEGHEPNVRNMKHPAWTPIRAQAASLYCCSERAPFLHVGQSLSRRTAGRDFLMGLTIVGAPADGPIQPRHYAFLISEADFDAVFGRIREQGLQYWADPSRSRPGEINHNDGGRGVYFPGPDGHYLEVITRPYGSGGR
jgi:catechol 2,3-dioxygenase-like lactoylglutathione lyase family enzyme